MESTNPSKPVKADSEILGDFPIFQEGDNVDKGGKAYVQDGNSLRMVSCLDFKGVDVEQMKEFMVQPSGLKLIDVATGKTNEGVLGFESSGLDHGVDKAMPCNLKPKSTWTRINQMDFGLGGLSKALLLPTRGKRRSESNREEEQHENIDIREAKHVKVVGGDDVENTISTGVESHPFQEQ